MSRPSFEDIIIEDDDNEDLLNQSRFSQIGIEDP